MRMSQLISAMAMSAVFVSLSANASLENEITIVNNFDHSLSYTIGINPELLPDLPVNFTLDTNGQAHSKFSDLKKKRISGWRMVVVIAHSGVLNWSITRLYSMAILIKALLIAGIQTLLYFVHRMNIRRSVLASNYLAAARCKYC